MIFKDYLWYYPRITTKILILRDMNLVELQFTNRTIYLRLYSL